MDIKETKKELNKRNTVDLGDGVILIPDGNGNVTIKVGGYEEVVKIADLNITVIGEAKAAAELAKEIKLPSSPAYGNQGINDRNRNHRNKPQ